MNESPARAVARDTDTTETEGQEDADLPVFPAWLAEDG